MLHLDPAELGSARTQAILQGAIAPRPICFASTLSEAGEVNLSPFSFFNLFSSNPPIVIFSPARRVRDNTTKHTLENVLAHPEVCINLVNYAMVEQMSLASTEYPLGVNEFIKSGFTMEPSECIRPPRVKEAPVQLECRVNQVVPLGTEGGAGNLVIAQVIRIHVSEQILNDKGVIDPYKIDLVARLGGDWYTRAKEGLFEVAKPLTTLGLGVEIIPEFIKNHPQIEGNDLGRLGNIEKLPSASDIDSLADELEMKSLIERFGHHPESFEDHVIEKAIQLVRKGEAWEAWRWIGYAERQHPDLG